MNKLLIFLIIGIYIVLIGIIYYLIYHKHHKRNDVKIDELLELFTKFFSLTTVSIVVIVAGFYFFINAGKHREDRNDVIYNITLGVFLISATIFNYMNYMKNSLKDFDQEERETKRKRDFRIGEILEIILFGILILSPLWKIPTFIRLKDFKTEMYKEIAKYVLLSIASMFIIYNLNPLDFKNKIFKNKKEKAEEIQEEKHEDKKEDNNEENKENEEKEVEKIDITEEK